MALQSVVVTGDITIDWLIARGPTEVLTNSPFNPDYFTQAYYNYGGARTIGGLLKAAILPSDNVNIRIPEGAGLDTGHDPAHSKLQLTPGVSPFWHGYAAAKAHAKPVKNSDKTETVWRIDQFLGIDRQYGDKEHPQVALMRDDPGDADLIVLDDAGQGFLENESLWPASLLNPKKSDAWLILKLARPSFQKPHQKRKSAWQKLASSFHKRIILVVTVNDLRDANFAISRGLSWERTTIDIMRALSSKHWLKEFDHSCAHVVVSMYAEGALLYTAGSKERKWLLHYDPLHIEGSWGGRPYSGKMVGYASCLTTAVALSAIRSGSRGADISENMSNAVRAGLHAQRTLQIEGYKEVPPYRNRPADGDSPANGSARGEGREHADKYPRFPTGLTFPTQHVVEEIDEVLRDGASAPASPPTFLVEAFDGDALEIGEHWSIVNHRTSPDDAFAKAKEYVEWGWVDGKPQSDWGIPLCTFGKFVAVGREETERLRALRELINEYKNAKDITNPLSIAVFGKPGSGKSAAIREIARDLNKGNEGQRELTFNLSQFSSAEAIVNCLHQVRDEALSGHEPLVFWDEFDSQVVDAPLGWLRYFLAPMQDGVFQAGSVTHRTGRAIFVFAGGLCNTMADFREKIRNAGTDVKGPDFESRLKGYLDVMSIDFEHGGSADAATILKRALQLRGHLLRRSRIVHRQPKVEGGPNMDFVNIDPGVLSAFLCVSEYRHASRSLQALVEMSSLSNARIFGRSSLPGESALGLHVSAEEFINIVRQDGHYAFPPPSVRVDMPQADPVASGAVRES